MHVHKKKSQSFVRDIEIATGAVTGGGDTEFECSLSKSYGGILALDNATLSLKRGLKYGLVGQNGAGKSTLIKIVAGIERTFSGWMKFDGQLYRPRNANAALASGVGVVPQELPIVSTLSVAENVLFNREPISPLGRIRNKDLIEIVDDLFKQWEIDSLKIPGLKADSNAGSLSMAGRTAMCIARVLAANCRLIFFDEATSVFGPKETEWLHGCLDIVTDHGATVVYVSHRIQDVMDTCTRVIVLRDGKTIGDWMAGTFSVNHLVEAMLGREHVETPEARTAEEVNGSVSESDTIVKIEDMSVGLYKNINISFKRGEIVGLAALEGSGQREFMEALAGLRHYKGTVLFEGRRVRLHNTVASLRNGIAFIPSDRAGEGLLLSSSVQDNIALPSLNSFAIAHCVIRHRQIRDLACRIAQNLGIRMSSPNQLVGELSGGNQQKVVFGKFLFRQMNLLLLYDCTRGVDIAGKEDIHRFIRAFRASGGSVIWYSSDLAEFRGTADRIVVMKDGVLGETFPGTAPVKEILNAMFGVQSIVT